MDGKAAYNENSRSNTPVIELVNLCKSYHVGDMDVPILKSIDLRVMPGEFVAIMGPSGSGKSTLMNMIGCLDRPNCGQVLLMGKDVDTLSDPELAKLRGLEIGICFSELQPCSKTDNTPECGTSYLC